MAYKLSTGSLSRAVRHLSKYGDTDIFPYLPEIVFFAEEEEKVVEELSKLDLDNYDPGGAVECLAPKSRLGFRLAHQLGAVDTVLMLASVIEIAPSIEKYRIPPEGIEAFSYRFQGGSSGAIFAPDRNLP